MDCGTVEVGRDRRKNTSAFLCEILAKSATMISQPGLAGERGSCLCVAARAAFSSKCQGIFPSDPNFITGVCKMKLELENRLSSRSLAVLTLQLVSSKGLGNRMRKNTSENKIGSTELPPKELK